MGNRGALTFAEGRVDFRTDVSIVLNNGVRKKDFVVRTCLQTLPEWKSRYSNGGYPFKERIDGITKDAFAIDKEIWIFDIDATEAKDIFTAVTIGMKYFMVEAEDIIGDVYVKNLNAENEHDMVGKALVNANRELYMDVCRAIVGAARMLGCENTVNFWVFSNSRNPKIPKEDLHEALSEGGATDIQSDEETRHVFEVGDNLGKLSGKFLTHIHKATLGGSV